MQMDALQRVLRALADGLRRRATKDPLRALASGFYGRATEASEAGGCSFDSGLDGVLDLLDHGEPVVAFEILASEVLQNPGYPQHVVEQVFIRVRRGQPRVLKPRPVHHHPAQLPHLRMHAERHPDHFVS
jgi:hypothetical protein